MYHAESLREKMGLFFTILWPILVTQISYNIMNLTNTIMSGRAGTNDLAGVAIGASLWMPVFTGLNGILLAVTPIVAQLLGSGQRDKISPSVTQALYLSVLLAIAVVGAGAIVLDPLLSWMNIEPSVHFIAKHYLIGLSIGIIPLFAANVLRYFFDAQGYTKITMMVTLLAVPLNILLNYLLIFGKSGFPKLGGIGAGYATGITYWFIFIVSILITFKVDAIRSYKLFVKWFSPSPQDWKRQLAIGIPMGLSIFFEASIFSMVTLLIGIMFNAVTLAAHQSAISFTSLLFMLPLSISMALTILVGYEVGGKRYADAKQYSRFGVATAMGILGICSIFLYLFREQIAYLYTDDREVVALMKQFLIFAIFYQLSDAAQASLQGVLRGYKEVTIPFLTALISYWGIGIPSGYLLASVTELGPFGFWIGITIGLTCAAAGFLVRLLYVQRKSDQ